MNNKNKYSPKETLGPLILANKNVTFKELDNLILSLIHLKLFQVYLPHQQIHGEIHLLQLRYH